ncbi:esterase-like activity of phytase family protein [Mycobacterium sp.]|uniref:esterase-like activity of phytase family protein n=1 Tax=Mycobacterium sp. TaxID=1785 RepID=UPI003A8C6E54
MGSNTGRWWGRRAAALLLTLCLCGCATGHPVVDISVLRRGPLLTYLGQRQLEFGATLDGTAIGGLSGISYDAGRRIYYAISDDRSKIGPARFYDVRITLSDSGIESVDVVAAHPLLDAGGHPFGSLDRRSVPPVVPPDPEGIAFDATRQRLYWSSEGERLTDGDPVLADPSVGIAGLDGGYLGRFDVPADLKMSTQRTGPRRNKALEGLTLTPGGAAVFAAMEGPGYNDGRKSNGADPVLTRITRFDAATGAATAQYVYPMEPPGPGAGHNGVPDLVALSDTGFLVLERSSAMPPVIRIYRADIGAASNILDMPSTQGAALKPMRKSLAIDLSQVMAGSADLADPLDNVEGITLGPKLPDGRQSVVLVSDDNFSPIQTTQFLLLAM